MYNSEFPLVIINFVGLCIFTFDYTILNCFNLSTVPAVSLASNEFTGFENNSSVTVTVVREGDQDSEIVVRLKTVQLVDDNSAIGESCMKYLKANSLSSDRALHDIIYAWSFWTFQLFCNCTALCSSLGSLGQIVNCT